MAQWVGVAYIDYCGVLVKASSGWQDTSTVCLFASVAPSEVCSGACMGVRLQRTITVARSSTHAHVTFIHTNSTFELYAQWCV